MPFFTPEFYSHLAEKLNTDTETVENAISDYISGPKIEKKKIPTKQTSKPKQTPKKDVIEQPEKHTCERIPNRKIDPCGKNAKKFLEDNGVKRWYCGTEKSGCYKASAGALIKKVTQTSKKPVAASSSSAKKKDKTLPEKKKISDESSKKLVQNILKSRDLHPRTIKNKGKRFHIIPANRILVERVKPHEAYGVLDDDDWTVLPLDDDKIRWLEANNIPIKESALPSLDEEEDDVLSDDDGEESLGEKEVELSDDDGNGGSDFDLGTDEEDNSDDSEFDLEED